MKTIYIKQKYQKRNKNKYFFKYTTHYKIIKCKLAGRQIIETEYSVYTEYLVKYPNNTFEIETEIYQ